MNKQLLFFTVLAITFSFSLFTGCKKVKLEKVSGFVQKGPFVNGTIVTITDLKSDLKPTGKTFSTSITDDKGTFSIPDVTLSSSYINLAADGYYFDEVKGELSMGRLVLNSIADVSNASTVNVNILSDLEKSRVEFLIEQGTDFNKAKQQAQQEVLSMFSISNSAMPESETLDISQSGDANSILLAISVILQGSHTTAYLTELLSNIKTDLREDGILNSTVSQTALINDAKIMNLQKVRQNIEKRYNELGVNATIGNFEQYIQQFINTTSYSFTKEIDYPQSTSFGPNILYQPNVNSTFDKSAFYSFAANLKLGTSLIVKMTNTSPAPYNPGSSVPGAIWYLSVDHNSNIDYTPYDFDNHVQYFTVPDPSKPVNFNLYFSQTAGSALIEYFENGSLTPSKTKTIDWQ